MRRVASRLSIQAVALASLTVAIAGASCGDSTDEDSEVEPDQACRDVADAVAEAYARCQDRDRGEVRANFIDSAANGDCDNVIRVRERSELYDECLPFWQELECADFEEEIELPASCNGQLILPEQ